MRMAFLAGIEAKLESLEEVRTMVNFMHQERDALEARRAQLEEQEVQQNRRTASAVQSQRASARAATAAVSKRNYEAAMDTLHTIAAHKAEVASHRQQIEEQAARRHQRLVAEGKINPAPFTFSGQYRTAGVGGAPPMGVTGVVTTWMAAKFRDPDAMPGLGFLGELSLNQVKARIAEVAKEKEEYLNDKREELRKAHEDEESNRQKFTEQINGHRAHSAHLTQKRNEDQKQRELSDSQKRKQQREGALKGYLDTFENTRLESKEKEQSLSVEWQNAKDEHQRVLAERRLLEQKKLAEFERGKERQIAERQQLAKDSGTFQYDTLKLYERQRQDANRAREEKNLKDTELIRTGQFPFKQRLD
eukprot:TRINITY_DN1580_c0_g1_i2.p1 TRINITY_DN1580_c0_g1~~TRINITY_DN1580_c0_g1_i2.p1  ORF type:complete len:362 (+),score=126.27 TRINITY_DN1580_c0_g1_i2:263-1348(+)